MNRTTAVRIDDVDTRGPSLSIANRDRVRWVSKDTAFTICFAKNDSPFDEYRFVVPAGGEVVSGPVRQGAAVKGYHYDITEGYSLEGATGGATADPTIFVDP